MPRQAGIGTRQKAILGVRDFGDCRLVPPGPIALWRGAPEQRNQQYPGHPAVKGGIAGPRGEVAPMAPAEFGAKAHEDTARFGELIKDRRTADDWRARVLTSKRIFYIK